DAVKLLQMLDAPPTKAGDRTSLADAWLGRHAARRAARKCYLQLARKWHPDKWALQGPVCVEVATDVTKNLVSAYEQACRELPNDTANSSVREDNDEEREVSEFASSVGISFQGMQEVWK
ncbi:unnamed protein product, partial [Polarella glacialis]